jgi:hypothetical protein
MLFYPEDGDNNFFRNFGIELHGVTSQKTAILDGSV